MKKTILGELEVKYVTFYSDTNVRVYDLNNDFEAYLTEDELDNFIVALKQMRDDTHNCHRSETSTRTDSYIKNKCKDLVPIYRGNWVLNKRIPLVIKAVETFINDNWLNKRTKEDLLNKLDTMSIERLHSLVQVIKRKENANETSRN